MVVRLNELGVNVFSIVIGALILIMTLAWIDAISAGASYVYIDSDDEELKYKHHFYKKLMNAFYISAFALLIIIILYTYYQSSYNKLSSQEHISE